MAKEKFNISFKKQDANTGLYAVGHPHQNVEIKVNKKVCGIIYAPNWETVGNEWSISLTIKKTEKMKNNNPNIDWVWLRVKAKFDSEEDAREYIKKNLKDLTTEYTLHFFED